jgi:hypothetical protein
MGGAEFMFVYSVMLILGGVAAVLVGPDVGGEIVFRTIFVIFV